MWITTTGFYILTKAEYYLITTTLIFMGFLMTMFWELVFAAISKKQKTNFKLKLEKIDRIFLEDIEHKFEFYKKHKLLPVKRR